MLLTSSGIENYISGVILQEETAKQATKDGVLFIKYLQERGIVPGIKVNHISFRSIKELQQLKETKTRRVSLKDSKNSQPWQKSFMISDADLQSGEQS